MIKYKFESKLSQNNAEEFASEVLEEVVKHNLEDGEVFELVEVVRYDEDFLPEDTEGSNVVRIYRNQRD